MASLAVPILYIVIVFGSLLVFSSFYRRRNANKVYESYFPRHRERDIYVSLLQKTDPPASETLLKAALVRRAMTDVTRIIRIREDKPAMQNLLQKGSIGDDLWNSLLAAEKELEAEILEVAAEANSFVEGWGTVIFQTATELMHNEKMRSILESLPAVRAEKERKYGKSPSAKRITEGSAFNSVPLYQPSAASLPHIPASASLQAAAGTPLPASPAKTGNGLAPPTSTSTDNVLSSDGEGSTTSRSPSKATGKKGKRRK